MANSCEKKRLRDELRQRRHQIPEALRKQAALSLVHQVQAIPGWESCRKVGGYFAADAEIDPAPLLRQLSDSGRQVYLPVIQGDRSLRFAAWQPGTVLEVNRYGIPEPRTRAEDCIEAGALDALLLPLVGWDRRGHRLGMGGGYYDRSLAASGALKIGLAYALQEIACLPADPWDIGLNFVATEAALHDCGEA